jgi:DNA-binding NtrC family response regulator
MTPSGQRAVLVVEDDEDLRRTVCESLEAAGFAAAASADANDAIERLKAFAYDGLVTDLNLPDGNGMDVLEEALTRYPQIRAVVVTGFGGVAEAVTAIKRGAIDFLISSRSLRACCRRRSTRCGSGRRTRSCARNCAIGSGSTASSGVTARCGSSSRRWNSSLP